MELTAAYIVHLTEFSSKVLFKWRLHFLKMKEWLKDVEDSWVGSKTDLRGRVEREK